MEDGAGGAAVKAAPRTVIEIMGGDFDRQGEEVGLDGCGLEALIQSGLEVADAFFHAAVVAGKVRRVVQGQDAEAAQDFIHGVMIEGRTVVAFEEQRRAVLAEQAFEMGGDLPAFLLAADQRPEAVARGEILHGDDEGTVRAVFGGIAGPDEARMEPVNVFHGVELSPPIILHQRRELTAGEAAGEPLEEFAGAPGAHAAMLQLAQERLKPRPVQRVQRLGSGRQAHGFSESLALPPAHDAGVGHEVADLPP